jgi:SM-20-related protein
MNYLQAISDEAHEGIVLHQHHTVQGYSLFSFDNALNEADSEEFKRVIATLSYKRTEEDRSGTRQRSMVVNFRLPQALKVNFIDRMTNVAQTVFEKPDWEVYRIYMNNNAYGDMAHIHRDSQPDDPTITIMAYGSEVWKPEWAGETLFYDENYDSVACVMPKFGRLAIFNGELPHKGGVPSRECYAERLTFVIKLRPPEVAPAA